MSDSFCNPMDYSPPGSPVHGDFPSKNTGMGSHFLFQGIFLIQGSNLCLLHCRWILYHWTTRECSVKSIISSTPCLLIEESIPFPFKVIIGKYVLTAILVIVSCFRSSFLFLILLLSSLVCWQLYLFLWWIPFSFLCVYLVQDCMGLWYPSFMYNSLFIYVIILDQRSLKFKCIVTLLHFYSPTRFNV